MTAVCARGREWLFGTALPLWAARGRDPASGMMYEALDFAAHDAGLPEVRSRVQARQVYVFASAGAAGWPDGVAIAESAYDFMRAAAWDDETGWAGRIDRRGKATESAGDLYDQAFALLAQAALFAATGDRQVRAHIDETLGFIDTHLAHPAGGCCENLDRQTPRRQNPHMHLLEAFLALHAATGAAVFSARAEGMGVLFDQHFLCAESGVLGEFFTDDWRLAEAAPEPGHHFEWAYLLTALHAAGGGDRRKQSRTLYETGRAHGLTSDGFAKDKAGGAGCGRRLWPQTEAYRAYRLYADDGECAAFRDRLFDSYLAAPVGGLWVDAFTHDGQPAAPHVPASTLYHLWTGFMSHA